VPEGRGGWEELHPSRQLGHQKRRERYHLTMISHGVEISIAEGVGEMVRGNKITVTPVVLYTHNILCPTRIWGVNFH